MECDSEAIRNALAQRDRERLKMVFAQARRDHERAKSAMAATAALQARLTAMEQSLAWRVTWPLRRLSVALPAPLRRNATRGFWLLHWTVTLQLRSRLRARRAARQPRADGPLRPAADGPLGDGPLALIIDDLWPRPDRDSGSIDTMNLIEALRALDFRVIYAAELEADSAAPAHDALIRRGVHCLGPADAAPVEEFLEREGGRLDLCVLNRVYAGGRFLEPVQRHCGTARIVFNTVDLHFIRLRREAMLRNDPAALAFADEAREREEFLVQQSDATLVVSPSERAVLAASFPGAYVVEMPLARAVPLAGAPFEQRHGIGFIGGFAHAPNVDGLRYFLGEIWPLVLRDLPGCEFTIVGSGLPAEVLHNAPSGVRYLGHLPDAAPWFQSLRLSVAPLRYGAGLKGKVISSLAAGVPCIATSIAVEGMGKAASHATLVADTPAAFAAAIGTAYRDPALWSRMSDAGRVYVAEEFSISSWRQRLAEMLWVLGVIPEPLTSRR